MFQAGNDIEQGRLSTPAGADEADKFPFCNPQRHIIEGVHMQGAGLKPLRDMFKDELRCLGACRGMLGREHIN
jgi:hypothetical protein